MSRAGAIRTAMGGVLRHKVQAVVIGLVLLIATASATLGFALLAASHGPFQRAFDTQHGADVALTANPARATTRQLAATRTLPGVTAAAGPFGEVTVQADQDGQPWGQLTLAGRPSPEGPVDDLVLNAGHWPDGPGQVVLDGTPGPGLQTGARLTVTGVPGRPALTVVGFANSVTSTAQGWVTPAEITRLQGPGSPLGEQMLYSFASAGGYPQLRTDVRQVARALPAGAVADPVYWLVAEQQAAGNGAIMEPFVVAFALIGLAMAVLIVGNVVSGAVVAQYHRIGVLKSIGLSPAQVVVTYLSRVGLPALAGCVAGVVVGNLLAAVAFGATAVIFAFGLAEPGRGQRSPLCHGPGAGPAGWRQGARGTLGTAARRGAEHRAGRRAARPAGDAARRGGLRQPGHGARPVRHRQCLGVRRRLVLGRVRHHRRALV
jgi:putative ABC transport system permease protein